MSIKTLPGRRIRLPSKAFALTGILLCALILRLAGVDSGLPLIFNGDEVTVVEHSLALSWADLNPHAFMYGSAPFYILKIAMAAFALFASVINSTPPTLPDYYLVSRLISVVLGTATVFLVFVFGRVLVNEGIGLLSAAIFAVSPLAVNVSHFATVDSMMGFWCALSFVGMALWLKGNPRGLYLAGIGAGLAIATKFNAAVLLLPIGLIAFELERARPPESLSRARKYAFVGLVLGALLILLTIFIERDLVLSLVTRWTSRGQLQPAYVQIFDRFLALVFGAGALAVALAAGALRNLNWALGIVRLLTSRLFLMPVLLACLVFLVVSPFVILDLPAFTRDFVFQLNKNISGGIVGYSPGTRSYVAVANEATEFNPLQYLQALADEWGMLIFAGIFIGLWALWRKDQSALVPFGSLVLLMLGVTATWRYEATRYLFPLWLLFAFFAALGIVYVGRFLSACLAHPRLSRAVGAGLVLLSLVAPLRSSLDDVRQGFLMPDTRSAALKWIEDNVPSGSYILREWGTPEIERASASYRVDYTGFPFEEATLADWKNRGVNIIIISTERYDFYQSHATAFQDVLSEYNKLKSGGRLLESFEPGPAIKGPPIYIYAMQ